MPGKPFECDTCIAYPAPFLFYFLALVVIESGEKAVEVRIAVVAPVELHAMAQDQSALAHFVGLLGGRIQTVQRRYAGFARELKRGIYQKPAPLDRVRKH